MDGNLQTLINLQAIDTRIAGLEADAARLPREIAAIHAAVEDAKKNAEQAKARLDAARKDQRAKEKDLEVVQAKRSKNEARLYEVKTNKEYSAVLIEIEEIKQEKARMEEEVLVLMEAQERLTGDIREADARFKQRESEGRGQEATLKEQLRGIEADLGGVRTERKELAGKLPANILADYDRILRARAGLALVPVTKPNFCGACRMTITPQRLQELRAQSSLIPCESCGRYLYWPS
ncbi:MAG TPA: C4-type zinc ribbon domain-containing protein [Methylomirabilota bacterium]|nr:C4-type zinc ribbon domain-containing protein [Methylomirabilota bacterium]